MKTCRERWQLMRVSLYTWYMQRRAKSRKVFVVYGVRYKRGKTRESERLRKRNINGDGKDKRVK